MSESSNPQFPNELYETFIPSRQEIQRILREEERLVEGSDGMEHLAVEVPAVFTAGCEYILKKLGYEECEENGMWDVERPDSAIFDVYKSGYPDFAFEQS